MFMLEMYNYLSTSGIPMNAEAQGGLVPQKVSDDHELVRGIHATCQGHIRWVLDLTPEAARSVNVWINGGMVDLSGYTKVPEDSPACMPYHIIKITEYLKVFKEVKETNFVLGKFNTLCKHWFTLLRNTKNIRTPTWQHSESSDMPTYRLSDQIWIWKALKGIEELLSELHDEQRKGTTMSLDATEFLKLKGEIRTMREERLSGSMEVGNYIISFDSEDIRKENLKRFTIKNDVFNKRMLSVTRSAIETRFLLHSSDTILYHGIDWGFFQSQDELLKELLTIQKTHDDSLCDASYWENPLRYGLALLFSRRGVQLETVHSADKMKRHAREVLLNSSSWNGLFPGQLNEDKQAMCFDKEVDRDSYFSVGFEIPSVLLKFQNSEKVLFEVSEQPGLPETSAVITLHQVLRDSRVQHEQNHQNAISGDLGRTALTLKIQTPYGVPVDLNKIVDVPEEWLFKDPDFLDFTPESQVDDIRQEAWEALGLEGPYEAPGEETISTKDNDTTSSSKTSGIEISATLLDIPKGRKDKLTADKRISDILFFGDSDIPCLKDRLLSKRGLDESKKRLVNIKFPTISMAITCYLSTPKSHRLSLAYFFQRHGNIKSSLLHDDVTVEFNTWTTELHCRFFRAIKRDQANWDRLEKKRSIAAENTQAGMRHTRTLRSKPRQILGSGFYMVDDVFSFMVVGDWCDRYWTCHVLETSTAKSDIFSQKWRNNNPHFPQRKVLELVLFSGILKEIYLSASDILNRVERDEQSSASETSEELDSNVNFKNKKQDQLDEIFQILRILRESITGIKDLIEDWKQRESLQGRQRPRWTRSDEQKYRKTIQKQTHEIGKHDREITFVLSRIDFLIALVNNEKSLSQARDVTRFTYATVFFLPVGLAVSIFSMNGAPDHTVILEVVITAVVALSVTVFILWSAIKAPISRYTRGLKFDWAVRLFKNDEPENPASNDEKKPPHSSHGFNMKSFRDRFHNKLPIFGREREIEENQNGSAA